MRRLLGEIAQSGSGLRVKSPGSIITQKWIGPISRHFALHTHGPELACSVVAMNASVQRSGKLFLGPPPTKRTPSCRSAAAGRPSVSVFPRTQAWLDECPSIELAEGEAEYKIVVPLSGIDPRKIYVFATSRSLLIEIRFKVSVCHELDSASVMERIDKRVSREFTLPAEIEQGGTTVEIRGGSLLIAARKSEREQQSPWSQLIHFDTRAGLGLV